MTNRRWILGLLVVTLLVNTVVASEVRADDHLMPMWQSADQRGERLLNEGKAAAAARTFKNPRWRAYARLKAGDYKAAASGFGAFNDTDAQYDRGNALARAGDLRDALAAYNAALAKDPGNKDARHNRELVENALRRRRLSHHNGGNGGSKEDAPRPNAAGGGQSARAAKSVGSQSSAGRLKRKEGRKSGRESATGVQNPNSGRADAGPNITDEKNLFGNPEPGDKKARARRDAQAAATASGEHKFRANPFASHERRAETSGQNGKHKPQPPASEQQLALQQWLRRIPNDPAGLLKRKFMIEHLMRQQKAQR